MKYETWEIEYLTGCGSELQRSKIVILSTDIECAIWSAKEELSKILCTIVSVTRKEQDKMRLKPHQNTMTKSAQKYTAQIKRNTYGNRDGWGNVLSPDGNQWSDMLVFESYKEAKAWINEQDECIYHLAHNEYTRPCYRLKRYAK